jgi:tetratricopeptide (TPR) repeat protein
VAQLMQCPHCGKMTDPKLDNCVHCGGILRKSAASPGSEGPRRSQTCPNCNALVQEGDIICVACGTNLLTGQKIAAIKADKPARRPDAQPFPWVTAAVAAGVVVAIAGLGALAWVVFNNPVAKAEKLHQQGRTLEAVELLTARIEKRPEDGRAQFALGGAQLSMGNHPAAAQAFDQAMRLLPARPDAAYLAGISHAAEPGGSGLDAAVAALEEAVRRDPSGADAPYMLGMIQARRGNLDAAAKSLDAALGADPGHARARMALGVVRALQGQGELAGKDLAQALGDLGDSPDALAAAALAAGLRGTPDEALAQLDSAIAANTSIRAQALLQAGLLSMQKGDYSTARTRLQEAAEADPANDAAGFFLATIRDIQGLRQEALGDYDTIGRGTGSWAGEASAQAARLYLENGEPGLALEACERALEKGAAGALVHTIRGRVYLVNGELEQARQALQQAVQAEPGFAPAHLETGLLLLQRNRRADAILALERYLELADPALPDARFDDISSLVEQLRAAEGAAAPATRRSGS